MKRKYYLSEWHWWLAGDVCGNVIVTDEIWREDYHCRGGLHTPQTKYWIIFLQRKNNTYDGGVTDPQRLSADASGREGGAGERLGLSKKISPLIRKYFILSGPKGPDGKSLRKLIDYFTSKDPHYVVEIRPNKRSQGKELGGPLSG